MKKLLASYIFLIIFLILAPVTLAQYGQYGAPSSLSIMVSKLVGFPTQTKGGQLVCDTSVSFANNFSPSDPRFKPNDFICFKVKVTNTSNTTLTNVTVKDFVPPDIEAINGPGSYDSNTKIVTISAGDFAQNEEKDYFFLMQVHQQNQLPADKGLFCEVNKSQAYNDSVTDDSTSQFCIEKQTINVVKTPSAGPEMGVLLITGEALLFGLGLIIKKRFAN